MCNFMFITKNKQKDDFVQHIILIFFCYWIILFFKNLKYNNINFKFKQDT